MMAKLHAFMFGFLALDSLVVSYRDVISPDMVGSIWGPGSGCRRRLSFLEGGDGTEIILPPDIEGEWVSSSCEVRSGPEFVTRKYRFNSDLSFLLLQFYYSDHHCEQPSYSLRIRGQVHLRDASLADVGATHADYDLDRISMISFNLESADRLRSALNSTCLKEIGASDQFQPNDRVHILNLVHGKHLVDCAADIGLSLHELQLIRQQTMSRRSDEGKRLEWTELLLGDVHSDVKSRNTYRPKTFQTPLRKHVENDKDCEICQEVHKGSEGQPPVLPKRTAFVPAPLHGEWASLTCEARPMYFLTRHFIFLGNTTWEAHYHFYSDPNCRTPIYSLSLKGTHSQPEPSKNVPGGTIVNLHSLGMLLTPQHRDMVRTLNMLSKGVCAGKAWKLGPTYDVTDTAECTSLGSLVPSTEYELVKIEVDPLYGLVMFLGQMPSDGSGKYEEHKRPTAYQEPLVHCEGEDPRQRVQNNTNHNGCSICVVSMWTWLGSLWCYLLVVNM